MSGMRRPSHRPGSIFSVVVIIAAFAACGAPHLAATDAPQPVPATYFGAHMIHLFDSHHAAWPSVSIGAQRLWDTGIQWVDIEASPGVFDFSHMDAQVALARQHGATVLYTLGQTPPWASSDPNEPCYYGPGRCAPPSDSSNSWQWYVQSVAMRYKGQIEAYEIWNEPNGPYWSGTMKQLVELTRIAASTIHAVDPNALVVGPAITGYLGGSGITYLDELLNAGLGDAIDVVSYHCYLETSNSPEDLIILTREIRRTMESHGVYKPLWDTESNWHGRTFPDDLAQAYVARDALLHWCLGYARRYWYAWDIIGQPGLRFVQDDYATLAPAGIAYGTIQRWMRDATVTDCKPDNNNIWSVTLQKDGKATHVVWLAADSGAAPLAIPRAWGATQQTDLYGNVSGIDGDIEVSAVPRLLS